MITSESALLIIDMQQGLFHGPQMPFAANRILSNLNLLITRARQSDVPLFFARHIGPDASPFSEKSPLTRLIPELQVNPQSDVVFTKNYPSCFRGTDLQHQLKHRGIKQLLIAGMKTEFCVDTTCRAAPELGFNVVLIADAHTTVDNPHLSAENIVDHHNQTLAGPFVTLATAADWQFDSAR